MPGDAEGATEFGSSARTVAGPPVGGEAADVADVEGSGFEAGAEVLTMLSDEGQEFSERHEAIANRAAHEMEAFVSELGAIVLQVDVTDEWRDAAGEVERMFGDGERVAGVDADAAMRAGVVAKVDELFTAEVLMIFDGEVEAEVLGVGGGVVQGLAGMIDVFEPAWFARPGTV